MQPIKTFLLSSLLATLVACATLPAQEMSDARQAIQAAEAAGASARSPHALDHARSLLEQAQIELANHDYAAARRTANASKEAAIQARQAADDMTTTSPSPGTQP
jgi:Cdc6-like AAA superfamily ATPase